MNVSVIPAQAGIQKNTCYRMKANWILAFAGMTKWSF